MVKIDEEFAQAAESNLSSFVNKYGSPHAEFADCVRRDHRTIQQSMMRLFIQCIRMWSEEHKHGNHDLRNEATCKLAREMVDQFDDKMFLPFV